MPTEYHRDLVGYGPNPPDPKWPNGARLALNIVVNFEEGSESTMAEDGLTEKGLTEMPVSDVKDRDLGAESMFEYGARVGFWRILRMVEERNLPMTIFGCALALERHPSAAAAIRRAGFDVCCHGWRWIKHYELAEADERDHIGRAIASLTRTVGERPVGWYCRYAPSVNTRRLLVEEGGFLYDSDSYSDELPYWVRVGDKPHLVVPYTMTNNDSKYMRSGMTTSDQFFTLCRDAFDVLYAEGKTRPKMMSVGLHMRITGHPARAAGLARFLDHVVRHEDVWVCRRVDIARHWHEHHLPPAG
jgi:allantoinase